MKNFKLFVGYSIPDINVTFTTREVVGGTRRLRAQWTPELAQDVESFHNINAESELTRLLSEAIAEEIDNEIINSIAFPRIRSVFSSVIGEDLVSVQPMNAPLGIPFYFDFKTNIFKFFRGYNL
jgi:hypothetical protein